MPKTKFKNFDLKDEKKWRRSLLWCPTQIYRDVFVDFLSFGLYLRWRWNDPFTFYIDIPDKNETSSENQNNDIIEKALGIGYFSCLFEKHNLFFKDTEYREAEKAADKIWYDLEKPRIKEILKNYPEFLI